MSKKLRARMESADIVQSICRRVLERPGRVPAEEEARFRAWLLQTIENGIVDHYRKATAEKRDVGRETDLLEGRETGVPDVPAQADPGPATVAERRESVQVVGEAIAQLEPSVARAFRLHALSGLSYEAVAEELGWTPKQARSRIVRARLQVAANLRQRGYDFPEDVPG